MIYDFHTHTFLSDGELSPLELIRRAVVAGYRTIAITDHAGPGEMERIIAEVKKDCQLAERYWNIRALPGIELTHLPPPAVSDFAQQAKALGAKIVVVHGETTVEPVEAGTNAAAVGSPNVDILAHPGLIAEDEAKTAYMNNVYLEISARKGHSSTNDHVVKIARNTGAQLLLNSDSHSEGDLLQPGIMKDILRKTGLSEQEISNVCYSIPEVFLKQVVTSR